MGNGLTNQGGTNRGVDGTKAAEAVSPSSAEAGRAQGRAKAEETRPSEPRPTRRVAADLGVPDEHVLVYGHDKAKIALGFLRSLLERDSKLALVATISPTPTGGGKTTTSIGLADGLARLGKRPVLTLREPSMGPVFGIKGGAVGGGKAQVTPGDEINLHFTGDFTTIAEANNLLAATADNALHFNTHDIDPRIVAIHRSVDMNDRPPRDVVIGLGGRLGGVTRKSGFDITAASQVTAIFCMADSLDDLRERLGRVVVGRFSVGGSVTAADLGITGAMTAILKDALTLNLVQTLEGDPALVHNGPFANTAHDTNSAIATKAALKLGDVIVTEAGFDADLGAKKFLDIIGQTAGIVPDLTAVVATARALKHHGGVALADLEEKNVAAVRASAVNLHRHCENLTKVSAQRAFMAVNRFAADTEAEIAAVRKSVVDLGIDVVLIDHFGRRGEGALDFTDAVVKSLAKPSTAKSVYSLTNSLEDKARAVVTRVYRGADVVFEPAAVCGLRRLEKSGWGKLPVYMAKAQCSLSTDPKALGAPGGFTMPIREVRLSTGAGFVVLILGSIITMPGLPKRPSACDIDVVDGVIGGVHRELLRIPNRARDCSPCPGPYSSSGSPVLRRSPARTLPALGESKSGQPNKPRQPFRTTGNRALSLQGTMQAVQGRDSRWELTEQPRSISRSAAI